MPSTHFKPGLHPHRLAVGVISLMLVGFIWMVTYGTFNLFDRETYGQFYDAQAESLLAGRWDVPEAAVHPEAYRREGKFYGYYGFVPAIPRMGLNRIFPGMSGSWSRFSLTIACAMTLLYCHLLLRRLRIPASEADTAPRPTASAGFVILAAIGSATIYLGSCAFIYHEAILWAVTLALACYYHVVRYLEEGRLRQLLTACVLAFLSFFCRFSSGCGPCLAILLLGLNLLAWHVPGKWPPVRWLRGLNGWSRLPPLGHTAVAAMSLGVIFTTFIAINHAKFGTFFEAAPMRFYSQIAEDPARFANTDGKWMRLGNIPTTAYAYFSPSSIEFRGTFPWAFLRETLHEFPWRRIDGYGPFSSVTAAMPLLLALALVGVVAVARGHRRRRVKGALAETQVGSFSPAIVLIGSLGGFAPMLLFANIDNRYLHEFFPFLILGAALGLHSLAAIRRLRLKSALAVVLIVPGLFQIYVNCSFALVYQRLMVWSRPHEPEMQMRRWQKAIDRIVITSPARRSDFSRLH